MKKDISNMAEQLSTMKKISEDLTNTLESFLESHDKNEPYDKLTKMSREAMNQIKKDLTEALQNRDRVKIKEAKDRAAKIDKMVDEVVGVIEKIKEEDQGRVEFDNPLYPTKKLFGLFPSVFRPRRHERGARNWLGFLVTGIGLIILSRGIWDASAETLSIQGSIIIGMIMIGLMAWLERRKLFEVFAGD